MANRRLEMYEYRQVLVRIRQGDSDRGIRRAGLMGRCKAKEVRAIAQEQGWLDRSYRCRKTRTWRRCSAPPSVRRRRRRWSLIASGS